jgi:hypothetical protein
MSKTNNKKRRNRLRSLVLLLFLTIVMLSTATYAWFTSNRTVSISTINVNIAATSGLQISADAITWKAVLSNADISGASTTYGDADNHLVANMAPVSTAGTVSSGLANFYSGKVEGDAGGNMALTTTAITDASNQYVVFDIFLKVDTPSNIYLQGGSGVVTKTGSEDKGLQNAARYGFINEGNVASTATSSAAQALMNGSGITIIEPNYDTHTLSGVTNATTYYGFTSSTNPATPTQTGASPVPYYGVHGAVTNVALTSTNPPGLSTPGGNFLQSWSSIIKTDTAFNTTASGFKYISGNTSTANAGHYPVLFSNLAAGITKVRVYMWVEGQDIDCENNASGTDLSYTIVLGLDDYRANP